MIVQPRKPRARTLAAAGLLVLTTLSTGVLTATTASADVSVHTIADSTPESLAPYVSSEIDTIPYEPTVISISCYLTGDTVDGPDGPEDIWDLVSSGGPVYVQAGTFVPDADVYTGSSSPVVPPCSMTFGMAIGNDPVKIRSGPGGGYTWDANDVVGLGDYAAIKCSVTGEAVTGPYGTETTWDELTATFATAPAYVPDALMYTGSNSAVVPHC